MLFYHSCSLFCFSFLFFVFFFFFFFFLMIRRPPRSTLFPTRRSSDLKAGHKIGSIAIVNENTDYGTSVAEAIERSEEHTSELQSHSDLVCRLLLEKKKKKKKKRKTQKT